MVQTLEAIEGGGGSMKLGTKGTISSLMSRELDLAKTASKTASSSSSSSSSSSRTKPPSICSFVAGSAVSPKRIRPKISSNEASSSSRTSSSKHYSRPEVSHKVKNYNGKAHEMPILESENHSVDEAPLELKSVKRGARMVEIVDIRCRNNEKARASPIKNPLKKLSFSKLSGSPV